MAGGDRLFERDVGGENALVNVRSMCNWYLYVRDAACEHLDG
jgi:hypothetical protein